MIHFGGTLEVASGASSSAASRAVSIKMAISSALLRRCRARAKADSSPSTRQWEKVSGSCTDAPPPRLAIPVPSKPLANLLGGSRDLSFPLDTGLRQVFPPPRVARSSQPVIHRIHWLFFRGLS